MGDTTAQFAALANQILEQSVALREFVEDPDFASAFASYSEVAEHGNSLLDLKIHLLLQYVSGLTGVGLAKLRKPNSLGPHKNLLVQTAKVRAVLERVRPLENKLSYQLEKVMKLHQDASFADPLSYKPNIAGLASNANVAQPTDEKSSDEESKSEEGEKTTGKYVPPRLTAMPYFDETRTARKEREESSKRRQVSRGIVQDWVEEFGEEPIEIRHAGHELGDRVRRKFLDKQREREQFEEDHMLRLNRTKKDKAAEKRAEKILGAGEFSAMSDIRDFDTLLNRREGGSGGSKKRKSGKFGKGKKRKRIRT